MIIKLLAGILLGAGIGAVIGHFGKCSSGGCPLTANPFRGGIYGGVMGTLLALSSIGTPTPATLPAEEQSSLGAGPLHIATEEDFNRHVLQTNLPCLVDFYSDHCPPCRQLAPTIEKLAEKYKGRAVICKINVDTATDLAIPYGIDAVPTVLFFTSGEEVQRELGLQSQSTYEKNINHMLQPTQMQEK